MKRSAFQCAAGFVGAALIVAGVVWTCSQLSEPTQLNAAQNTAGTVPRRTTTVPDATAVPGVKGVPAKTGVKAAQEVRPAQLKSRKIRPVAAATQLNLSLVDDSPVEPTEAQVAPETSVAPGFPANDLSDAVLEDDGASDPFATEPLPQGETSVSLAPAGAPASALSASDFEDLPVATASKGATSLLLSAPDDGFPATEEDELDPVAGDLFGDAPLSPQAAQPLAEEEEPIVPERPAAIAAPLRQESQPVPAPLAGIEESVPALPAEEPEAQIPSLSENKLLTSAQKSSEQSDARLVKFVERSVARLTQPGADELNGAQTTQIVVEKTAPEEVLANKPATVVIRVKNQGTKTVRNILLHDSIPENTQFVSSDPEIAPSAEGELLWPSFDLEPQREKKFEYVVVPGREGDFGSVATVLIPVNASSRTKCSRPELQVAVTAPDAVELGQNVNFEIVVTNVGTGTASGVALLETIPEGLFHPSGEALNNSLGAIKPGESKRLPLVLKSVAQGECVNRLVVTADDCEDQEVETRIVVAAPQLELSITGATNVYLDQSATYKLGVKNTGDAAARGVQLVAQLPDSLEFVETDSYGVHKDDDHCVYWDLAELGPKSEGEITLKVKSVKADSSELVFGAFNNSALTAQTTKSISIDGLAALSFSVTSSVDLLEAGKELDYVVQIVNRGTKASSNVVLQALAPDAISIVGVDGPTEARKVNGVVVFGKIPEIAPKTTVTYKIKARANESGDCRVGFQLSSDDLEPLVKEVNTRVYE